MLKPEKPEIPIEEFYRSSSLSQLIFNSPKLKSQLNKKEIIRKSMRESLGDDEFNNRGLPKSQSGNRLRSPQDNTQLLSELDWDEYFSIMWSKNNMQQHKHFHEYFDKPIIYTPQGFLVSMNVGGKTAPMENYNTM